MLDQKLEMLMFSSPLRPDGSPAKSCELRGSDCLSEHVDSHRFRADLRQVPAIQELQWGHRTQQSHALSTSKS